MAQGPRRRPHPRPGHGRVEPRTLNVAAAVGLGFRHAAQAIQPTHRVRDLDSRTWRSVIVDAVTSLTLGTASPAQLAASVRGHLGIENQLHWSAT